MGGLIREQAPNGEGVTIETQSVEPHGQGVLKKSTVKVDAPAQAFVMGVRIGRHQTISELKFDGFDVLTRQDAETARALEREMPSGPQEQWVGFALRAEDLRNPRSFRTRFALSPFPAAGHFQTVSFVMAMRPEHFADGRYLVAASILTSPSAAGPTEYRRS